MSITKSKSSSKIEEEKIEEALSAIDQSSNQESLTDFQRSETQTYNVEDSDLSPTLQAVDVSRRPKEKTACETCPNSMWFASPVEVKCYCRVMFLVSWSTKEPNQITDCDGMFIGQE